MSERSWALDPISKAMPDMGSNSAGDIDFHFAFSPAYRSSQLAEARTNEIKHDIHHDSCIERKIIYLNMATALKYSLY